MKVLIGLMILGSLAGVPRATATGKVFPVRLVIPASQGGITFLHFVHAQRVNFNCDVCHASRFKQDATARLEYGPAGHQSAEEGRVACGGCHYKGGRAFSAEGNCNSRCHTKYAGNTGNSVRSGD